MQNKRLSIPPVALTATLATTLLEPGPNAEFGNTGYTPSKSYILFRHMRVANTTSGALTVSLFKGAAATAAAGTEFAWSAASVPANGYLDWFGELRLDGTTTASALCGGASSTGLTLNIDNAEIGLL
jgi:hypothetical protein